MLPTPPRFRHKVEPHNLAAQEKDRERNRKRKEAAIQKLKDDALLSKEHPEDAQLARRIQREKKIPMKDALYMAKYRAPSTATVTTSSATADWGSNIWPVTVHVYGTTDVTNR